MVILHSFHACTCYNPSLFLHASELASFRSQCEMLTFRLQSRAQTDLSGQTWKDSIVLKEMNEKKQTAKWTYKFTFTSTCFGKCGGKYDSGSRRGSMFPNKYAAWKIFHDTESIIIAKKNGVKVVGSIPTRNVCFSLVLTQWAAQWSSES